MYLWIGLEKSQQATMTERYNTFHEQVTKLRADIYKLRQKMKVGLLFQGDTGIYSHLLQYNKTLDCAYNRTTQSVNFSELRNLVLDISEPKCKVEDLSSEDADKLLEQIPLPDYVRTDISISFLISLENMFVILSLGNRRRID